MTVRLSPAAPAGQVASGFEDSAAALVPSDRRAPRLVLVRLVADVIALASAIGAAFGLRFGLGLLAFREAPLDLRGHLIASALWIGGVLWVMSSHRLYDEDTLSSRRGEASRVRASVFDGVAVAATALFLLHLITVSRGWFLLMAGLTLVLLLVERTVVRAIVTRARAKGMLRRAVVLVGGGGPAPVTDEFDVVARFAPEELDSYLSALAAAPGRHPRSPGLLLQADTRPSDQLWDLVVRAGGAGLPVYVASPVRSVATDRLTTREIDGRTIVKVSPPALIGLRAFQKRAYDLVLASLLLVLFALPMAVIAAAILITSGGPVLYGQERVGRGDRVFRMWKFRTMRVDAEVECGPVWAARDDPRRTPIGRVLRTLSLDELPQLWNVLVGDMSIVGPRPERPSFVKEFSAGMGSYGHRHRIRPGMTGLAQVKGLRGDTALTPRIEADNRYIEHWSLLLDVGITLRTVIEVLRRRNAG